MKLAQALLLRADVQKKIASLRERIARNVMVQDGDTPHEDPAALLLEAGATLEELQKLVVAINTANLSHTLPDGRSLTEAMAARDALVQRHALYQSAIDATQREPDRYSAREIKWTTAIDIASIQKQSEDLARQIRELNGLIQETNWKVDL
ncbi:DIP1984 family protein [Amphibiibacter pelophylacis]|uniref:DIP1984 family protein n=1 Tax=Amphibiibacter pelophylacis TaxID=1799477 RepID=A0ACC6NYX8_9BURK